MTRDLNLALDVAAKACNVVKNGFEREFQTVRKADNSLVTEIDQASERLIIEELQKKSSHAILSEESGELPGTTGLTWIIDPIDGTTNFSRRLSPFAVSIGLVEGDESVLGVIQNPMTNDCFYAEKDGGAFLNGRSIHVSTNDSPHKSIVMFDFGTDPADRRRIVRAVEQLIYDFDIRTIGTTAWEICTVAKGTTDAFICLGDKLWDFAAGMCIVQQAGADFGDWRGEAWDSSHSFVLAAQPNIKPFIIEKIRDLQT